jgi:hypothetical protein
MSVEGHMIYNVIVTGSARYIIHMLGNSRLKKGGHSSGYCLPYTVDFTRAI